MYLGLNWLAQSLALSLTLNGLLNYSYGSANLNIFDGKRFEKCVNTILSKYPFVSKKDLRKFNRLLQESSLKKALIDGFEKKLSELLTEDDSRRESREEAYLSAVERCSLLVTGNPENDLLKELLSFDRYKRELGSGKKRSRHNKRRHSKTTSKSSSKSKVRQKRDVASYAIASSSASVQGGFQAGNSVESVMRGTLISSSVFTKVFHTGLLQTNAQLIGRDVTKAGLYGYNVAVVDDAVKTVTGALSLTTLNTNSENYAFIFARSIAEVLKRYELLSEENGRQIANGIINEIQKLLGDSPPTGTPVNAQQSNQRIEDSKNTQLVQTSVNGQRQNLNQNPPIQPSPVVASRPDDRVVIFRNKLTSLLAESRELSDLFCRGSSPNIFQTVKTALSDYGLKISVNAAVVATDAFMALNSEQSCSQYANLLSEVIRDVLFDNGLLESVKPEDVALKIVSNAKTYSNLPYSSLSETPKEDFKSPLPLLPSFPETPLPFNNNKEDFHDSSGSIQNGFVSRPTQAPTLYEVKEQNPIRPIQTPPLQATALQSEPSNQRTVDVRNDAFAFVIKLYLKNLLSHSGRFASVFKQGIAPNEAADYASKMARAVLSSYDPAILLPADNQIREAVFKIPIGSQTSVYSEVFASVLIDVLSKNDLIKDADSKYIGDTVINALNREVTRESVSVESFGRTTEKPPLLPEPKASTPNSGFQTVEPSKRISSSVFVDQVDYATTPIEISRYSDSTKLPNLSADQYKFVPTTTMAPRLVTPKYVPDYTQASEFVNSFMRAFDKFTSAPDPNYKSFSDAVVGDPEKLSEILVKEMESSVRILSQPESSELEESDPKTLASSKTVDNVDRKHTNAGEPQSEAGNAPTKNANSSVGVAANSSQPKSVARNPSTKLESSFTPTPASFLKEDSQQQQDRYSDILKNVSSISTSGIAFIRSQNYNLQELCSTLNGFAELVGIEPVPYDNCAEVPLIDYLLHVLREVSYISKKD